PERSEGAAQRLDASTAVRHPDSVPQNLTRQPSNNPITTPSDTGSALTWLMEQNTALEVGGRFEYDDVIDPADTRDILTKTLRALPAPPPRAGRKRTVDAW
ncbi:MAG: hypothetical protein OXC10_04575, partial [Rhodospirillaceae bacterium]|nr:hypothetical protein [Rhodospirillaceae bacterium]